MRYRKLSPTGDYMFGQQQADFYIDEPNAVAQAVETRLRLWLGQWYLNTADGTDWANKVLGNRTSATRDALIRARVSLTPGVTAITDYQSNVDPDTRRWSASFALQTQFGAFRPPAKAFLSPEAAAQPQPPPQPINVTIHLLSETSVDVTWEPYAP